MIERKIVLGVYSDSSLNNVELSLIETDGIDIFEKPVSLLRPYSNELKDEIYKFMLKGDFSDTLKMSDLSKKINKLDIIDSNNLTESLNRMIETLKDREIMMKMLQE